MTRTKHLFPFFLFSLTTMFAAQNENLQDDDSLQSSNSMSDSCCPPKDSCAKCAQLWPGGGPDWIITPNAGPCVSCGADLFVTAEFIYWAVRQDGLEFAYTDLQLDDLTELTRTSRGKSFHADGTMEPGFKVGLGMLFDCDGWDLYANYTWLRTRKNVTATPSGDLSLIFFPSFEPTSVLEASSQWKHDFNVIDLELGRNFFISSCLHLRPHFGFKGTWQKQDWNLSGIERNTQQNPPETKTMVSELEQDYWGIGIRTGLDTAWHFTRCFSLVGESALTVLWQRFEDNNFLYEEVIFEETPPITRYNLRANGQNNHHTLRTVVEGYLGLRWEDWFCCDEYHYSLEAGWELQWWGDQNRFTKFGFGSFVTGGDLGLQGLTIKARFDF